MQSSDDKKIADACSFSKVAKAKKVLIHLKELGLVGGKMADDTGWVFVCITPMGKQIVRENDIPWYKKISWSTWVPIISGLIVLTFTILSFFYK